MPTSANPSLPQNPIRLLPSVNSHILTNAGTSVIKNGELFTNDTSLGLSGTAPLGSVVRVYDRNLFLGNAVQTGDTWTFNANANPSSHPFYDGLYTTGLWDGQHAFHVEVMTADGFIRSNTVTATVVTKIVPATMNSWLLTGDSEANDGLPPSIKSGAATKDTTVGLSGGVEAGQTVTIMTLKTDGSQVSEQALGEATIGPDGKSWQFTTPELAEGEHLLWAQTHDVFGNAPLTPFLNSAHVFVTIDTTAPLASMDTQIRANNKLISGNGYTKDKTLTLSGTAEAGTVVEVFDGQRGLGKILSTDASGKWTFTTAALSLGEHALYAKVTDHAGNTTITNVITPTVTQFIGDRGKDKITGTSGNDVLVGGGGRDTLLGGDGDDVIVIPNVEIAPWYRPPPYEVLIDGGPGKDTLKITGNDTITMLNLAPVRGIEVIDLSGNGATQLEFYVYDPRHLSFDQVRFPLLRIVGDQEDGVSFATSVSWYTNYNFPDVYANLPDDGFSYVDCSDRWGQTWTLEISNHLLVGSVIRFFNLVNY